MRLIEFGRFWTFGQPYFTINRVSTSWICKNLKLSRVRTPSLSINISSCPNPILPGPRFLLPLEPAIPFNSNLNQPGQKSGDPTGLTGNPLTWQWEEKIGWPNRPLRLEGSMLELDLTTLMTTKTSKGMRFNL